MIILSNSSDHQIKMFDFDNTLLLEFSFLNGLFHLGRMYTYRSCNIK